MIKEDHIFFKIFPAWMTPAVVSATYYFGHGYDGLSRCLEKPLAVFSGGIGSSTVILRNLSILLGNEGIYDHSYFFWLQTHDGFSGSLWITMYPWIASDVTFVGSIFVLFFFGWLMGLCWISVLKHYDPFAAIFLMVIFSIMMHCHNTFAIGDYIALILFWVSLVMFLFTRRVRIRYY
jgi:hypothetical protein